MQLLPDLQENIKSLLFSASEEAKFHSHQGHGYDTYEFSLLDSLKPDPSLNHPFHYLTTGFDQYSNISAKITTQSKFIVLPES